MESSVNLLRGRSFGDVSWIIDINHDKLPHIALCVNAFHAGQMDTFPASAWKISDYGYATEPVQDSSTAAHPNAHEQS
jgi:hypothetical protein